jgi:hypothetical protein
MNGPIGAEPTSGLASGILPLQQPPDLDAVGAGRGPGPGRARTRETPAPAGGLARKAAPGPARDATARDATARDVAARERPAAGAARRSRPKLTGRGAVLVMFVLFFLGSLIGVAVSLPWLAGFSYLAGCLVAAVYARREALLLVVTTPPLIFGITLAAAELITASRGTVLATVEGTMLTLAAVAGWLFTGTAACLAVATARGLPRCIRELRIGLTGRADLADDPPGPGADGS